MNATVKYSEVLIDHLVDLGYTHCFFLGGGNVMHLIEAARTRMECIPVVHEVSAGIAAEYFNVANRGTGSRAVVFVTAGPGLTNLITAIGGAWLESRELLIIGGQARTEFLSRGTVRQIGHQEIDGVGITRPITKKSVTVEQPLTFSELQHLAQLSSSGRKGPVFIELCLDVSATFVDPSTLDDRNEVVHVEQLSESLPREELKDAWNKSERPLLLVGQGLEYPAFAAAKSLIENIKLPVATSWNAADYLDYDHPLYAGRPNTYGMRWANAVVQQCDLLVVVGARLGLQQTGFNWEEFAPLACIVHIDIDELELEKANPGTDIKILADANDVFAGMLEIFDDANSQNHDSWLEHIALCKRELPTVEESNDLYPSDTNPFVFMDELSSLLDKPDTCLIPCSSGGTYTTAMQAFRQREGQLLTNDKGLASMGYGLAGAIGTSVARPESKVVLVEGDGGFVQNINEIGTVANRKLNLKMIVFSNGGYASIRLSQKAYFDGNYIGCDAETGIGLPNWSALFAAYNIPVAELQGSLLENSAALEILHSFGPGALVVKVNKEQPFYPKLTSRIYPDGSMKSNPIHLMSPPLGRETSESVFKYLPENMRHSD